MKYTCAKNYQKRPWFDKVIAKIMWCSFLTHSVVFELSIYCNARFLHFAHVIMPLCCLLSFRQLYCTLWDGLAASSQKYITGWCRTLTSLRHCCNVFAIAIFSSYFRQGGYVMPFVCLSACLSVCLSVCLFVTSRLVSCVCLCVCLSVCSRSTGHNSTAIFTKLHTQSGEELVKSRN